MYATRLFYQKLYGGRANLVLTCAVFNGIQGVNTPDSILQISCLTPKDREDLDFMLGIGVDWVALSFVQRPEDIVEIKALIEQTLPQGVIRPHVMAKIEKPSVSILLKSRLRLCP